MVNSLYGCSAAVEFHWWKVEVTMLKDRKKAQRSKFGSAPAPVEHSKKKIRGFFGGIPPVKWRHLADSSWTSGAAWWTSHELILRKFVRLIFKSDISWRIGRALVSPPLRTLHELILRKFVRLILKSDVSWRIGRALVSPPYGQFTN